MLKPKPVVILIALAVITLSIRLYISFQTPYFSDDTAYFHLRQVEHIRETGIPLYNDELSYGGRTYIFMPLFQYVIAFFVGLTDSLVVGKIIPNLAAVLLMFIVFSIVKHMTKNEQVALFTGFISGFIPIYFVETVNSLSVYTFSIPLTFLLCYFMLRIDERKYRYCYLLFFIIFIILHPSLFLFVMGFIIYFIITKTEQIAVKKGEIEILFFSVIVIIWTYFIVFKKAFLSHGYGLIFQNIPQQLLVDFFRQVSLSQALNLIGFLPVIIGIWMIHYIIFSTKDRDLYFLTSFIIIITLGMWFKLLELNLALIYLGVGLVILFGKALALLTEYIATTKVHRHGKILYALLIIFFIVTSVVPSIILSLDKVDKATSKDVISALSFVKEFSQNPESTVLSTLDVGHAITYFTKKKNVIDKNFLMIDEINERMADIETIFSTQSTTIGTQLLNKYNVEFVILSETAKERYGSNELRMYAESCFERINFNEVTLYKNLCTVVKT
ncbi:glycosyltransferase family 39 protein [Candidatus Woesearchaeota archaeon]|nr:glycosyltransferase family 39 protein [Candidatus Woesearchaeota archaeon]